MTGSRVRSVGVAHWSGFLAKALTLALLCLLVAAGCRNQEKATKPARPLKLKTVSLAMLPGANETWPVRVELVRVEDVVLVDALLRIKTSEWFGDAGQAFRQAHPEALYDSWEVVPGTDVGPFPVRRRGKYAGVLFCNTRLPVPPLKFERNGAVIVNIDDVGCSLVGAPSRKRRWTPW